MKKTIRMQVVYLGSDSGNSVGENIDNTRKGVKPISMLPCEHLELKLVEELRETEKNKHLRIIPLRGQGRWG